MFRRLAPCRPMGIISKSVAHACSGGARGLLRPNDQECGKAAGVVKFYRDQEKPGRYVSESKDQVRVLCISKYTRRHILRKPARTQARTRDQIDSPSQSDVVTATSCETSVSCDFYGIVYFKNKLKTYKETIKGRFHHIIIIPYDLEGTGTTVSLKEDTRTR